MLADAMANTSVRPDVDADDDGGCADVGDEGAEGADDASARRMPTSASVWCRRDSIASMYPFGGPRLRDGPRKVQAAGVGVSGVAR